MVHSKPEVLELVESVRGSAGEAGKGSSGFTPFGLGGLTNRVWCRPSGSGQTPRVCGAVRPWGPH